MGDEQERLDRLQEKIDHERADLAEQTGTDDEPRFIDEGTIGEEVVDDTIAPPG
jgi:hypothetical protein